MNLTPVRQNLRQFEDNYTVISAFLDKCLVRLYLTNFYNKHILNSVNQICFPYSQNFLSEQACEHNLTCSKVQTCSVSCLPPGVSQSKQNL